jgi:hypothetical protein
MTKKLDLDMVTLLCVETRDPLLGEWAIEKCTTLVNFGRVVLITNLAKVNTEKAGIDYIQSPHLRSIKEYSQFMMGNLSQYVSGTHVLVIQWDSFITNPDLWDKQFFEYDYIGPIWPHHPESPVGNGGFSLRSIRLLKALTSPLIKKGHPEDYYICAENKTLLEVTFGICFAPIEIAEQFAVERSAWHRSFGFHGLFNFGKVMSHDELKRVIDGLPRYLLKGLDAYDLANDLLRKDDREVFKMLAKKITFTWKMRYRFITLKLQCLLNRVK